MRLDHPEISGFISGEDLNPKGKCKTNQPRQISKKSKSGKLVRLERHLR